MRVFVKKYRQRKVMFGKHVYLARARDTTGMVCQQRAPPYSSFTEDEGDSHRY